MDSILSGEKQSDRVKLHFVLSKGQNEETCSALLRSAFKACMGEKFCCLWRSEDEVVAMTTGRTDVFILDPFEGAAFSHLSSPLCKSVVLGPQCLLACLRSCHTVPPLRHPMYTAAMRDMVVTCTGFERADKMRVERLVQLMAGVYTKDFHEGVTHLVAAVVASKKYQVAVERQVPVVTVSWVHRLWTDSCQQAGPAGELELHEFRCPVLLGLRVCVSQMARADKDVIKKIIENNGGVYMAQLHCDKTDILICPSLEGEKASFARKWQIACVTPEWLYDSVEKLVCLPYERYRTSDLTPFASTPCNQPAKFDNLSVSSIQVGGAVCVASDSLHATSTAHNSRSSEEMAEFDAVNIGEIISAGQFLDGCKMQLMGFDSAREERLRRILNAAGAVRLAGPLSSVSHVLLAPGAPVPSQLHQLQQPPAVVTLGWLLASWRQGHPLSPPSSPLPTAAVSEAPEPVAPGARQESAALRQEGVSEQRDNVTREEDQSLIDPKSSQLDETLTLFKGISFSLSPLLDRGEAGECRRIVAQHGGLIVDSGARHLVCPLVSVCLEEGADDSQFISQASDNAVTLAYLQHCVEKHQLLPLQYYHRPVRVASRAASRVLHHCVLAISCYSGRERQFLAIAAESMGAVFQEVFARRDNAGRGVRASTLLVCPVADGNKCGAALRWGVPVVTRHWLLACLQTGRRVDTAPYTVTSAPPPAAAAAATDQFPPPPVATQSDTCRPPVAAQPSPPDRGVKRRTEAADRFEEAKRMRPTDDQSTTDRIAHGHPVSQSADKSVVSSAPPSDPPSVHQQLQELNHLVQLRCSAVGVSQPPVPCAPLASQTRDVVEMGHMLLTDSEATTVEHDIDTQGTSDITWNDPRERQARRQLLADSEPDPPAAAHPPSSALPPNPDVASVTASDAATPRQPPCGGPSAVLTSPDGTASSRTGSHTAVFAFSGFEAKEKERLCECVRRLGAEVSESASLERTVTHLVTAKPNRSEKHLVSIASGLWMLRAEYLHECQRVQRLTSPEQYEWSGWSDKMAAKSVELRVSLAATRWRSRVQNGLAGAFHDLVVVLLTSPGDRLRSFQRLIEAGAGRCVDIAALSEVPCPVTHVLMEPARVDASVPTDRLWRQLHQLQLPCLAPVFLSEFLMSDSPPSVHQFYVDKYRQFLTR